MSTPGIALIVGLGNPGARYADTRHNAGFRFVAELQARDGFTLTHEKRFDAEVGRLLGVAGGAGARVMTPSTFMNLSGRPVAAMAAFYRIARAQILVVHDELDLAPGIARIKIGGGHGGHNGLRDVIARLGGADFMRLRIGVGHPGPTSKQAVASFVLAKPAAAERALIDAASARALGVIDKIIDGEVDAATKQLHTADAPAAATKPAAGAKTGTGTTAGAV